MTSPLHARLAAELRRRMTTGELPVGAVVPSEAALVEEFGASRGTIRMALAALRSEGLIDGGQGRSPVVRSQPMGQPFETFLSFSAWAELSGRVPGQQTVEVARRAPCEEARVALGLAPGVKVIEVLRLRLLDGSPTMVERSTFVDAAGHWLLGADTDAGSIYALLRTQGVDLHEARHVIDAVAADEVDAELLDCDPGAPLLRERRTVSSADGVAIEFADDRYRPDRATFTINNARTTRPALVRDLRRPGDHDHD